MYQRYRSKDRRRGGPAVPQHLDTLLSVEQRMGLRQVENFGWRLAFVRHPPFETPLAVVEKFDRSAYAVINEEGELEFSPDLKVRH